MLRKKVNLDELYFSTIPPDSADIIEQVIHLADRNKKTLGFLPKEAIVEHCINGKVFVCYFENKVYGYIYFSYTNSNIVKIYHLCIDETQRCNGIARRLFEQFKKIVKFAYYIELSCRDDYNLNDFWHNLGFDIVDARQGRSTRTYSVLHKFRYKIQNNLLDIVDTEDKRPKVILDCSIILDDCIKNNKLNDDFPIFLFSNDVKFCIAQVVFEDISRQRNSEVKSISISKANIFTPLGFSGKRANDILLELEQKFTNISVSDRKQLGCAIYNNVKCFVTNDQKLISQHDTFADEYGILIMSLNEFVYNLDVILDIETSLINLSPSTHLEMQAIKLNENEMCRLYINTARGETKKEFISKLRYNNTRPILKSLNINGKQIGIAYYACVKDDFIVYLLRFSTKIEYKIHTLIEFVIWELIQFALHNKYNKISIIDNYLHKDTHPIMKKLGFMSKTKYLYKFIGSASNYINELQKNALIHTNLDDVPQEPNINDTYSYISFEKRCFPAKFTDCDIPCYIIPIKPTWARSLLTPEVETQYSLLDTNTKNSLMLPSHVYYTERYMTLYPGRVLWYVSAGNTPIDNTKLAKHIVGTSYIDESYKGDTKNIFSKFWKKGVFSWNDIKKFNSKKCSAIIFSKIEIFPYKIPYNKFTEIIQKMLGKGHTAISIRKIPNTVFLAIYKLGYYDE